ncbi:MAG: CHAT domain-containing protein [Nannocystaceae bacterium]|nr:CHAT domain-containing protein [Nannocystaceae bacterium]
MIFAAWLWLGVDAPAIDPIAACDAAMIAPAADGRDHRCYYVAARRSGGYARAVAALERRRTAVPDDPWAAYVLADLWSDLGDARALSAYGEAAAAFAAVGDRTDEAYARMSWADAVGALDLAEATRQLELAAAAAAASDDAALVPTVLAERARQLWRSDGDLALALAWAEQAQAQLGDDAPYQPRLVAVHVQASLLEVLQRTPEAIAARGRMAAMARSAGDGYGEIAAELSLAALLGDAESGGDRREAIAHARAAATLADAAGHALLQAEARCMLGRLGDGDAQAHFEACAAAAADDPSVASSAALGLGWLALPHDPVAAAQHAGRAALLRRDAGTDVGAVVALQLASAWATEPPTQARATATRLLDAIEPGLARQRQADGRARFLARYTALFDATAAAALREPDDPAALQFAIDVSERLRGRVLVERLEAAQALALDDGAPHEAQRRHDAAVDRILAAEARLLTADVDDPARAQWQRARDDAEREAVQAWDAIADATVAPALRGRDGPTMAAIQAALADDELLLVYTVPRTLGVEGPQPLASPGWVLRIARDHARAVPLPELDGLDELVPLWQGAIERRDGSEARPAAGLFRRVLAPALASLPTPPARLSIVPDGALHTLPWAALREDPEAAVLGERIAVAVVPSLRAWLHLRQQPAADDRTVVIAAPTTAPSLGLPPLPHAAREADAIAASLGPATIVRGDAASRAWLLAGGLAGAGVVHVAAHALVDDVHPERAAIVLAPGDDDDGLVHLRELSRLDLHGAIVTLASCRSAQGAALAREGPLGLARGLLLAGARTVVATAWRVRDDEAAAFAQPYAAALARGESVATAVQTAQAAMRARGIPAAGWAAFVVIGDGTAVVRAPTAGSTWVAIAALACAAAVAGAALVLVRRR